MTYIDHLQSLLRQLETEESRLKIEVEQKQRELSNKQLEIAHTRRIIANETGQPMTVDDQLISKKYLGKPIQAAVFDYLMEKGHAVTVREAATYVSLHGAVHKIEAGELREKQSGVSNALDSIAKSLHLGTLRAPGRNLQGVGRKETRRYEGLIGLPTWFDEAGNLKEQYRPTE